MRGEARIVQSIPDRGGLARLREQGVSHQLWRLARAAGLEPRAYVEEMLIRHRTVADAARAMGVHRATLQEWKAKLQIAYQPRHDRNQP